MVALLISEAIGAVRDAQWGKVMAAAAPNAGTCHAMRMMAHQFLVSFRTLFIPERQ